MTKLEEKLLELGYEYIAHHDYFQKRFQTSRFVCIIIDLNSDKSEINDFGIEYKNNFIRKQEQIDNLQQAFKVMQQDLSLLREELEHD